MLKGSWQLNGAVNLEVRPPGRSWTPGQLFLGGFVGAWYDPSDLTTMFQDTGAVTPVTADGQSVLRINDKSGNGLHLTQAVGASAPLYKTSGGLSWLQFDGTDDFLSRAAVDLSAFFTASMFCSARKTDDTNVQRILEHGPNTGATVGFSMALPGAGGANTVFVAQRGATTTVSQTQGAGVPPQTRYLSGLFDLQTPNVQPRVNGVAGTANAGATGGGNFGNQTMYIGARAGTSQFALSFLYQLMFVMKTASATEIFNAENYCRIKAGL